MKFEPQQIDFTGLLFPGRTVLYVNEVAERLRISQQHVIDLIEAGDLAGINIGQGGRRHYRIPVAAYEEFLRSRHSLITG